MDKEEQLRLKAAKIAAESREKREGTLRPRVSVANIPQEIWDKIVGYAEFDETLGKWVQAVSSTRENNPFAANKEVALDKKGNPIPITEYAKDVMDNYIALTPTLSDAEKKEKILSLTSDYNELVAKQKELLDSNLELTDVETFVLTMNKNIESQNLIAWEIIKMLTNRLSIAKWLTIVIENNIKKKLLFSSSVRKYVDVRGMILYFTCWYLGIKKYNYTKQVEVKKGGGSFVENKEFIVEPKLNKCLWLSSDVGRGKTTLIEKFVSVMNEYDRFVNYGQNPNAIHIKEMDLLNYEEDNQATLLKYAQKIWVFDDLFKDEKVKYTDLFAKILRRRYVGFDNHGLRTIVITNEKFNIETLNNRYGGEFDKGAGVDRLKQMFYEVTPLSITGSLRG